jgi:hypothetical protein
VASTFTTPLHRSQISPSFYLFLHQNSTFSVLLFIKDFNLFFYSFFTFIMSIEGSVGSINGETSNANKGYQNDTLNPYFLHPNENPALVLVTPLLSGNNYHSWSRSMTVALRSKNKIHFINGSLPCPPDEDRNSLAWDRCNTMVMA